MDVFQLNVAKVNSIPMKAIVSHAQNTQASTLEVTVALCQYVEKETSLLQTEDVNSAHLSQNHLIMVTNVVHQLNAQ